jgi:uncharacterized membrane protein YbaN (DUF454 family)
MFGLEEWLKRCEYLLSEHEALSSHPGITKKKKIYIYIMVIIIMVVLGIKPGALHMLGTCSTTDLYPQPLQKLLNF